MTSAQISHV